MARSNTPTTSANADSSAQSLHYLITVKYAWLLDI